MKIDFYLHSVQEASGWKSLWRELRRRGVDLELVLEPPDVSTDSASDPRMQKDIYDESREFLTQARLTCLSRGRYDEADAVVTGAGVAPLWRYRGLKIRAVDGAPACHDALALGEMNVGFDAAMVAGEPTRLAIAPWLPPTRAVITGAPRFAAWGRGEFTREAVTHRFGLSPKRKTVVYLPTWGPDSSLDRFSPAVVALGRRYNVIFKPHHQTLHCERPRYDALRKASEVLVDEVERDIVPFLVVADLVLADLRSGALTEAMLVDRTTIAINLRDNRTSHELLEGIEQAVPICGDPNVLDRLVDELMWDDPFGEARRRMATVLFQHHAGRADAVTADAIVAVVVSNTTKSADADLVPTSELVGAH